MKMKYRTRNLIELSVAGVFTVQVIVHLRASDVAWFNDDFEKNNSELIAIISKEILPLTCREEVEMYYARRAKKYNSQVSPKEVKVMRESKKKALWKGKTSGKLNYINAPIDKKTNGPEVQNVKESRNYVSSLETKWYFGDTIQVACQVKTIRTSHRAALIMNSSCSRDKIGSGLDMKNGDASLATFQSLLPIQKLIIIYCYPLDNDPKSPMFSGFPRTEFIPLSSIFKDTRES